MKLYFWSLLDILKSQGPFLQVNKQKIRRALNIILKHVPKDMIHFFSIYLFNQ